MSTNTFVNILPGSLVTWSTETRQPCFGVVVSKEIEAGTCVVRTIPNGRDGEESVVVQLKALTVQTGCTGCGDMSRGGCLVFGSCGGGPGGPP
jgi:hypothetical protein